MTDAPGTSSSRLGPFRHSAFSIYWVGGFLSNLGTWLQVVAGSVFVYQVTGSVFAVGLLNFAGFLPIVLFSMVGGVLADRFDRRRLVIACSVASLAVAAGLAILAFGGAAGAPHVVVAFFALNTSYALAKPALVALVPSLVPREEQTDAVGMNSLQFISGQIVGPILATVILASAGAAWAFAINAITFIGPIVAMAYLVRRGLGGRTEPIVRSSPGVRIAGIRDYTRDHAWVVSMLLAIVACSAPLEVIRTVSPALVSEGLGEPASAAGLIVSAQSVGSALAILIFVPLRRRQLSRSMASVGFGLQAVGLVATSLAPNLPVAALGVGLTGFGFSLAFPVVTGALQEEVPDAVRGRVMAFHQIAFLGNRPAVALGVGAVATMVGVQASVLAGLAFAPLGILVLRAAWRQLSTDHAAADVTTTPTVRRSAT